MRVAFRLVHYKDTGLRRAPLILSKHLKGTLEGIGKRLVRSSRSRMREDLGNEKRSLTVTVTGSNGTASLRVMSTLMQAFTDAYGLKRGTFPPFGPTSRLYSWARRRATSWTAPVKQVEKVKKTKTVARRRVRKVKKISRVFKQSAMPKSRRAKAKNSNVARIAFLTARAIYRRGIKPTHWNKKALEANRRNIINDLKNGLARAAREIKRG